MEYGRSRRPESVREFGMYTIYLNSFESRASTLWLWISKESLTFEGLDSLKIVRCFTGEIWRSGGQGNVGCGVDRL